MKTRPSIRDLAAGTASLLLVALPGLASAQGFTVDITKREEARLFYKTVYASSENVPHGWTGSIATCTPGTVSAAYQDATLRRLNYYRAIAGQGSNITFTEAANTKAQAAALIMSANKQLDRSPSSGWLCYTEGGREGAAGNLLMGDSGPKAIDTWVRDDGVPNRDHRRSLLLAGRTTMGAGHIPVSIPYHPQGITSALLPADSPVIPNGYCEWPRRGYLPRPLLPAVWSLAWEGKDMSDARVTMRARMITPLASEGTEEIPVNITSRATVHGQAGLMWSPDLSRFAERMRGSNDIEFTISVTQIRGPGVILYQDYKVTVFDPAVSGSDTVAPVITGPDIARIGQSTAYTFNAIPPATSHQWSYARLAPATLTDGAEAGMNNFQPLPAGKVAISTAEKATGAASFRVGANTSDSPAELTFKNSCICNASSQLVFSHLRKNLGAVNIRVEFSKDQGTTWDVVTSWKSTDTFAAGFNTEVVKLSELPARPVMLRFAINYEQGGNNLGGSDGGWFIDDIRFVNVQETVTPPTVASVPSGTSFSFTPPEAGDYLLAMRAQVFGSFFTDWSAFTVVKTTTPTAPIIRQHPTYISASSGGTAAFTTVADGAATLAYQWKRNGIDVPESALKAGTQTAKLTLRNITEADAGNYTVVVSNGSGNQTSQPGELHVSPPAMELPRAVDMPGQSFASIPGTAWTNGQPPPVEASPLPAARGRRGSSTSTTAIISHDGEDSVRTGFVGHDSSADMETTMTGPALVSFWWRVDSEAGFDFLHFQLDGTTLYSISGLTEWEERLVFIPSGQHQLRWRYSKDESMSCGADAGWVDQVGYTDDPPLATLAEATGSTGIRWSSTGDASWIASDELVHSGTSAARSGLIEDDQESRMEATVMGPADLSFWWELDAEGADTLTFEMDGIPVLTKTQTITDDADSEDEVTFNDEWEQKTVTIPAGLHKISWVYRKDSSESEGLDAAYVDGVTLTPRTPGQNGEPLPRLDYTISGPKMRLTWPAAATGWKLQTSTTLSGWADVPAAAISIENDALINILDVTDLRSRFYRLARKP